MIARPRPFGLLVAATLLATSTALHLVAPDASASRRPDVHIALPETPPSPSTEAPAGARTDGPWPQDGQAAYEVDGTTHASPGQQPTPIASLAKVMTAYLVLQRAPAATTLTVTAADVADTARRQARGDSVVPVQKGEVLDRTEALEALLLPSANNVAVMLARLVSGSTEAFVRTMNATARSLHMTATRYTDPSGFDPGTVSTAADQLLLVSAAMALPELARIVALPSASIPVAGTLVNTDTLLGHDGVVGVKTGSTQAAGGCFAFRVVRGSRTMTGVVLGQRDGPLIAAGLQAALALADRVLSGNPAPRR